MAKPQIIDCENGATIIYQKQNSFNGAHFVIGFRGGSKLDGEYKGLSHLLEHLLFREVSDNLTQNILNNIFQYSINQNAFTSKDMICVDFSVVDKNIDIALDNAMRMITKTHFTDKQIKNEIDIVKQEINLNKINPEEEEIGAVDVLLENLAEHDDFNNDDILGTPKTLNTITPDILKRYVKRYFNLDNLVVSVTSNKSMNEVVSMINEKIFSKLSNATKVEYVVDFPKLTEYKNNNLMVALPQENSHNVVVDLLIRENTMAVETLLSDQMIRINKQLFKKGEKQLDLEDMENFKYAYDVIESYMMNNIGGVLWNALRGKKGLVYSYSLNNIDLGTAKYKCFEATTNGSNLRTTTKKICDIIKDLGENSYNKQTFTFVKQALVDQKNATLQKYKNYSAMDNFQGYMMGLPVLDYEEVTKFIGEIDYNLFSEYVKTAYHQPNISMAVQGKFDTRKCYNLVEIEQLVGNNSHKAEKAQLNTPIIQATQSEDSLPEIVQQIIAKNQPAHKPEQEVPKVVTIDNKELERNI